MRMDKKTTKDDKEVTSGKLLDIKWSLGMAISSDSCKHLNMPYVTLLLTVEEPNGSQLTKSIEMQLSEFQRFHTQLKQISSNMATI